MTDLTPDCNLLGKPAFVEYDEVLHNQRIGKINPAVNIDKPFLYYVFLSDLYLRHIKETATGSTVRHTSNRDIYSAQISLPPTLTEQRAIAQALSDTDALIQSLDQLVAKKRLIKQGAMQQLLTIPAEGGRRLPGFSGEWHTKQVEDIAEVKSGKRLPLGSSLVDMETEHPYIRVADMYEGGVSLADIKYVPNEVYAAIMNYRIYKADIFISVAGTLGIVGKIPEQLDGANLTENADRLTDIKCNRDYLLFVLMSTKIQGIIKAMSTLGAQPKLALEKIRKFEITLPPTLAEQQTIAQTLSDMDAEIAALEAKRDKYRQVKQGMMQQLLTGKIRLIKND